jgi:hypothetical protein
VGIPRVAVVALAACGRLGFSTESVTVDAPPKQIDAPLSPSGTYKLVSPVIYMCASGLVDIDFDQLVFADTASMLSVTSNDTGATPQPCKMTGSTATSGHIDVQCTNAGACNEIYHLTGAFTSETTWTGTFEASFTGLCLDCTTDQVPATGTR